MTDLELDLKRVRDALYLLERHGELKVQPGNKDETVFVWLDVGTEESGKYVYSVTTESNY